MRRQKALKAEDNIGREILGDEHYDDKEDEEKSSDEDETFWWVLKVFYVWMLSECRTHESVKHNNRH